LGWEERGPWRWHKHLNPRLLWCGGLAVFDGDLGNSRNSETDTYSIDLMRCILPGRDCACEQTGGV
jgi:hypothetical protein